MNRGFYVITLLLLLPCNAMSQNSGSANRILHTRLPPPPGDESREFLVSSPPVQPGIEEVLPGETLTQLPLMDNNLLDDQTARVDPVEPTCVFTPCLGPQKRYQSWNTIDPSGALSVAGNTTSHLAQKPSLKLKRDHRFFTIDINLQLVPEHPVPLPSVSPEMILMKLTATPSDAQLRFWKDEADNFFVAGTAAQRVRLQGIVGSPKTYLDPPQTWLQDYAVPIRMASNISPEQQLILSTAGIDPRIHDKKEALEKLVTFFRSFKQEQLEDTPAPLLDRIITQQRGVCRHRAYAFLRVSEALDMDARAVSNETHVFVEVNLGQEKTSQRWIQVDLGGGIAEGISPQSHVSALGQSPEPTDLFGELPVAYEPAENSVARQDLMIPLDEGASTNLVPVIRFISHPENQITGVSFEVSIIAEDATGAPLIDWWGILVIQPPEGPPLHQKAIKSNSMGAMRWVVTIPHGTALGQHTMRVIPRLPGN